MPPADPSSHLRPPRQDRSRATLDRIHGAAVALLAERGPEGVRLRDVVERAGTSVGSFYARFSGREQLLQYLHTRARDEAVEGWSEKLASPGIREAPLAERVRAVVEALLDTLDGTANRVLLMSSDPATALRARMEADAVDIMLARTDELRHAEPERAAAFAWRVLLGAARELPLAPGAGGDAGGGGGIGGGGGAGSAGSADGADGVSGAGGTGDGNPFSRPELENEITRLLVSYLTSGEATIDGEATIHGEGDEVRTPVKPIAEDPAPPIDESAPAPEPEHAVAAERADPDNLQSDNEKGDFVDPFDVWG